MNHGIVCAVVYRPALMTMIPILSVGTHSSRAAVWRGGHSHSRLDWVQIARSIEGGEKHSEIRVGTLYQTNSVMYLCGYMDVSTASDVNPTTESVDACYERRDMEGKGGHDENENNVDFRNRPKAKVVLPWNVWMTAW